VDFKPDPALLAPRYARASQGVTPAPRASPETGLTLHVPEPRRRRITSSAVTEAILEPDAYEINAVPRDPSIHSFREPVGSIHSFREPVSSAPSTACLKCDGATPVTAECS
jgi:hypothetical protein